MNAATTATAPKATTQPVATIEAGADNPIEAFAGILTAKMEASGKEQVAILSKIERNTAPLLKIKKSPLFKRPEKGKITVATVAEPSKARIGAGSWPKSRTNSLKVGAANKILPAAFSWLPGPVSEGCA